MSNREVTFSFRAGAHTLPVMSLCFLTMHNFVDELVQCANRDFGMDAAAIRQCRDRVLFDLKNERVEGMTIEDEAAALNLALELITKFLEFPVKETLQNSAAPTAHAMMRL